MRICSECGMFVNDGETHTPEICIVAQIHEYEEPEPNIYSMGCMVERARIQIQEAEDQEFMNFMITSEIHSS